MLAPLVSKKSVLFIAVFLLFTTLIFPQETDSIGKSQYRFELVGGLGFPEMINIKLKLNLRNVQVAIGGGFYPDKIDRRTVGLGLNYHFKGRLKYTDYSPWYTVGGLNLMRTDYDMGIDKILFPYMRVGRTVDITEKIGISIDLGACLIIDIVGDDVGYKTPILPFPSGNISVFLRFTKSN
jgi:hypothetical protein